MIPSYVTIVLSCLGLLVSSGSARLVAVNKKPMLALSIIVIYLAIVGVTLGATYYFNLCN